MNRGYVIVAQNSGLINYIKCAEILSRSIKTFMPDANVTLLTDEEYVDNNHFDNILEFPYGDMCKNDTWKLANDWQVYWASPYDYTIKLEADIYIPRSIDYWWDILEKKDLVISTTIRNINNQVSNKKHYRKTFEVNKLPDTYNAITYFRKSNTAEKFFTIVKDIFINWNEYKNLIKVYDGQSGPTTDVVYGLAARILGEENCTLPGFKEMSMVHMKQGIIETSMSDWSEELIWEISDEYFRINTVPQLYPVHYYVKSFAYKIQAELYDRR